ncbi:hypothetical protein DSL64_12905 [Dyadobacter luteus]|uniref:Uncharacterized protein n=1 Tax=Dyadobacter luteus TaxID=2259619 RepID=A0A3D8YBG9_9BACT|nr:hypothetical protein [Dyadobacter luteus]REA61338.1 hypothetical protein DSL64_12905 [Dyadobacter luteus]
MTTTALVVSKEIKATGLMNYEPYEFILNEENTHFKFQSVGKRGVFDKAIAFTLIGDNIYNLALLDFDPIAQNYTDQNVTDNGDMPEVLATVMAIIQDYLNQHPERKVYLVGNSRSRTRLYQIAISKVIDQMSDIAVLGYYNSGWIQFEPNMLFESFLIIKIILD